MVPQALQELVVHLEHLVSMVLPVPQELVVLQVLRVQTELLVQAV